MGLQTDLGAIQSFEEAEKQQKSLKIAGIRQYLHRLALYSNWTKQNQLFNIKWGEEIEGHFLRVGKDGEVELNKESFSEQYKDLDFPLMLEYGSWMFEMIPQQPYNTSCNFYQIVHSIRHKYRVLAGKPRMALTIPVIPFIGVKDIQQQISSPLTQSLYIDDDHVAPHPRFLTHTNTITKRRGGPIDIRLPIFKDTNTTVEELSKTEPDGEYIHMDAVAFGMGNCCLQCTFSTKDFNHARYMYDQLNVISPLMLAMTAGSPFYKGKISDWDIRWKALCDSVDDRTPAERDLNSPDFIPNSRCSEASYYLWDNQANLPQYNDFYTGVKEEDVERVRQLGKQENVKLDERMAFHIANIFKRDYLIVYENYKKMTKEEFILCEMINGTNWNSVRLKIPLDDNIGWRVQFRTMEVQLTADENSAYSLFIHFITRRLHADPTLNFYIPISKLRENFNRAHQKDALRTQRFFFRTNIHDSGPPIIEELTVAEILFGKGTFAGIFHQIESRVQACSLQCDSAVDVIARVKQFLFDTATGNRLTLAQWMRRYVNEHPQYTHNSILSRRVMSDLLLHLHKISIGSIDDPNFRPIFPAYGDVKEKKLNQVFQQEQIIVGGCCNNVH